MDIEHVAQMVRMGERIAAENSLSAADMLCLGMSVINAITTAANNQDEKSVIVYSGINLMGVIEGMSA